MAASGLVGFVAAELAMNHKVPRVQLVKLKNIFHPHFEKNGVRNRSDIAKCLEQLNGVLPKSASIVEPFIKTSLSRNFTGLFGKEAFTNRLERSASSDSIAVSNFSSSSDQGSVDSCTSGSDSNSGSSPCSPEEPDRFSRAGSPHLVHPHSRDDLSTECCKDSDDYLRTDISSCSGNDPLFFTEEQNLRAEHSAIEPINHFYLHSNRSNHGPLFQTLEPQSGDSKCIEGTSTLCVPTDSVQCSTSLQTNNSKPAIVDSSSPFVQQFFAEEQNLRTKDGTVQPINHFYLQQNNCSMPNSNCVPSSIKTFEPQVDKAYCVTTDSVPCSVSLQNNSKTAVVNSSSPFAHQCLWSNCKTFVEGNEELVEHMRSQHVQAQIDQETYVCLWNGCKVHNRPSCSLSWLERHILSHGGTKPFQCIVDQCTQRFPTQAALQKHVNSHFDSHGNSLNGRNGKCKDEVTAKGMKRKRQQKCKKRNAIVAKSEDFFDPCTMEQIRYKLVDIYSNSPFKDANSITFHSEVKAIKTDPLGEVMVLLHWSPEHILPDSWEPKKCAPHFKQVPYRSLPPETLRDVFRDHSGDGPRTKQRRK